MKIYALIPLALSLVIAPAFADDVKPAPAKGQDSKEAKDAKPADNEASLDDLLKLGDDRAGDKDKTAKPPVPTIEEVTPGKLTGDENIDTLLKAIAEMEQASQRLRIAKDAGLDTQRLQESILKRLDQAIASAQKQKQQQQQQQQQPGKGQKQEGGSPQNEGKPQPQPGENKPGEPQQADNPNDQSRQSNANANTPGGPIEESRIEWGRLPARIRGELDQGLGEKFSPLYKKLTEAYYRRLAEEGKK